MHGETNFPPPRTSTSPLFTDRLCLLLPGHSRCCTKWDPSRQSDLVQVCSHLWLKAQYLLRSTFICQRCIIIKQGVEAELSAYMNEDIIPHTESSTAWRAANSARFPVLAVEAKRYLSAPPTSVTSEHLFSSAAQVLYRQMLSSCAQTSLTHH